MKRNDARFVRFDGEDGDVLTVVHSSRGEPYRHGIDINLTSGYEFQAGVFLEAREVVALRDLLNKLYPPKQT